MRKHPTAPDFSRHVACVLGLPFDVIDMAGTLAKVHAASRTRRRRLLSTANLHFVISARRDGKFRHSILHSDLVVADGMPIVWVARLLGLPIRERVPGSGLFDAMVAEETTRPTSVYFFGGPPDAARAASEKLNARQGGVRCAGHDYPGHGDLASMSSLNHLRPINEASPDFLVVALGAEKGQAWIEHNRSQLKTGLVSHMGAVVNFAAGSVRRAPPIMQRTGLEWLWRIKEEPSLWRRYANDAASFGKLMLLSVLPLCGLRLVHQFHPGVTRLDVTLSITPGLAQLKLAGACLQENLDALRPKLAQLAASRRKVVIDLSELKRIDASAMGLLLLLSGFQRDIQQSLRFDGVSSRLRWQFALHGADWLLEPLEEAPAERSTETRTA